VFVVCAFGGVTLLPEAIASPVRDESDGHYCHWRGEDPVANPHVECVQSTLRAC